jgi:hypothetical protein
LDKICETEQRYIVSGDDESPHIIVIMDEAFSDFSVINDELETNEPKSIVKSRDCLWDYVIEDNIDFFDPECSYELTGYKPITETKGLDFNPE